MIDHNDLKPKHFRDGTAREYMRERMLKSDAGFAQEKYDLFGGELEGATDFMTFLMFMYKFYFRAETHGIDNIPIDGPGLIVSNHAPILPIDGMMMAIATLIERDDPRMIRAIISRKIASTPFFSVLMSRIGQVIGSEDNVRRIFENENLMLVFPTGSKEGPHTIFERYKIKEFQIGFMEYALKYRTPIVPTCVIGSEEAAMTLATLKNGPLGFKGMPITPIFPWLGVLGLVPFPSKFFIYFGEPVDYFTEHADNVDNPEVIRELVEDVKNKVQGMMDDALGR